MFRQFLCGFVGLVWVAMSSSAFSLEFCRTTALNKEGYGPIVYLKGLPYRSKSPERPQDLCVTTLDCSQAANGLGYGKSFWSEGVEYKKIDENWSKNDGTNWCKLAKSSPAPAQGLFEHKGKKLFLTGVNLGNVQFIPFKNNPYIHSEAEIKAILRAGFKDLAASGVNSYRFWLHIDGSRTPSFDLSADPQQAMVSGLPAGTIEDLQWVIRTAYQEYGLLINITLWSHDVLAVRREHSIASRDRVLNMFNNDDATQHYIDKALTPLVEAMRQTMPDSSEPYSNAVMSWEVFNEPEGVAKHWRLYWNYQYAMEYGEYSWRQQSLTYLDDRRRTESAFDTGDGSYTPVRYKGWHFVGTENSGFNLYIYKDVTDEYPSEWDFLKKAIVDDKTLRTVEIPHEKVLRFINRIAGAIHRLDPQAKVSTGAHSIPYNTDIDMPGLDFGNAPLNYYSDQELIRAGGDKLGTLDFYQVHGYPEWNDAGKDQLINMFKHPKSHWKLDKPLVVGEHWSIVGAGNEMLESRHYEFLHDQGYAGVWGWAYFHVRESQDPISGQTQRSVSKHENQDQFRSLFQSLPPRLRYKLR